MACGCFGSRKRPKGGADSFVMSRNVAGLTSSMFDKFLYDKKVALVMFYHPMLDCKPVKLQFKKASEISKRDGLAFGAVNCQTEEQLCCREEIRCMPFYKLYSKGKTITIIDDPQKLSSEAIKLWVETVAVFDDSDLQK